MNSILRRNSIININLKLFAMKKELLTKNKTNRLLTYANIIIISLFFNFYSYSQFLPECDAEVPLLVIDLSNNPDSIYISPYIQRVGQCCSSEGQINFISFYATLHPNVAMVEIGIEDGANPSGAGTYHFVDGGDLITAGICVDPTPAGGGVCIPDGIIGPNYKIAYGKPGNNENTFYFRQILRPTFPEDDSTRVGCTLPLNIYGLDDISITAINSSLGSGDIALYNSYLNCLDCSSPIFEPSTGAPSWIDYVIEGVPQATGACGTYQSKDTVRLYTFAELTATYAPNPAEICLGGDINITATATGGNGIYSYDWMNSNGGSLSILDNHTLSIEGSYTVEINDGLSSQTCPSFNLPVSVVVSNPPTINAGIDQTLCATNPDAFLAGSETNVTNVLWSGGLGSYSPDNTSLLMVYSPTSSEINAGFVTLTLQSTGTNGGCQNASDEVTIYFSDTITSNPIADLISCSGDMSVIDAAASGGTAPYSYSWSTGAITSSINVSAGAYSVTVTDVIGCQETASISVVEPSPIILDLSSVNTSLDGTCDGSATVSISGGTSPYTILWDNLETSNTSSNLCYGVTSVQVTDDNGCIMIGSVVVNNPTCSAFQVTADNSDVLCYGDESAQAFSYPTGGNTPYSYSWNSSPVQSTQNASNLGAGTYTITVTDNLGCIDVASITVIQPTTITNTMTHIDASSIGGNEGSATVNPMGGSPGFSYTWNPSGQITQTASNLSTGTYYVNIVDDNSCLKVDSIFINQPPCNDFTLGVNTSDISCNGVNDGSAYIIIAQGTAPYSISWSNGKNDVTSVYGLAAGAYTVTVTDASNCTTFSSFDIIEPNALSIGLVPTDISCFGEDDGTIDLTVSGGLFPYSYEWMAGSTVIAINEDLDNLAPDIYSIQVTDANGCSISDAAGIVQPQLLIGTYELSDITCNGDANGEIDVTTTGGILPYSYMWMGPDGLLSNDEDLTNLELGLYELYVLDGNNCSFNTVLQSYINEPDSILIQDFSVECPVPGADVTLVSIDSISGGAGGNYQVSFDNGITFQPYGVYSAELPINNQYNVIAQDSNGCINFSATIIDIDPKIEIVSVDFDPCIASGQLTSDIIVSPIGGNGGPYEVSTDGGATFNSSGVYTISVNINNSYSIIVRDENGCESELFDILIPNQYISSVNLTSEASCFGANDGSIDLSISGGTSPYTVSWSGSSSFSSSDEDLFNLIAGLYNVTITDDSNCVIVNQITVTTINDVIDPIIVSCGSGNQNEESDIDQCYFTQVGNAWDAIATDDCFLASLVYNLAGATTGSGTSLDGVAFNLGTTTVTWTATDGLGNTSVCSFDVEIVDVQLPAISSCGPGNNQEVFTDENECFFTQNGDGWDVIATDNCSIIAIEYNLSGATSGSGSSLDGVIFNLGNTTVIWTVTDNSGNVSTCSFDIEVNDIQLPIITECGPGENQGVFTDENECSYTHNGIGWDAIASDNCTISTISYELTGATTGNGTSLDGVIFMTGLTTVTWTVSDNTNNSSTCEFIINVMDIQNPIITSCGGNGIETNDSDLNSCTYTNIGSAWNASASDNCAVSSITYSLTGATTGNGESLDGVVFNLGTTSVLWTVSDNSGNISTCSFDVEIIDNQLPAISSCGADGDQLVNSDLGVCSFTQSSTNWDAVSSDNCGISAIEYTLSGATTGNGSTLNGVEFNLGLTVVLWTVTDNSNNVSTCSFNVIVEDIELPIITSCGPEGNLVVDTDPDQCTFTIIGNALDGLASDNCSVSSIEYILTGATTGSGISLDGVAFNIGITNVTWIVTDDSGNEARCTFEVQVIDNELPAITSCGAINTQNVNTDAGVCAYTHLDSNWDATASDNCTISTLLYTLTGATVGTGTSLNGITFNQGITNVTWTASDNSGNQTSCQFDVIVSDNEVPVISGCLSNILVNNDSQDCGALVSWIPPTFTDNCGAIMTSSHNPGDEFPIGTTTVSYTVVDGSENVSICSFDVIVTDNELPQFFCLENIESCFSIVSFDIPLVSDNCGIASLEQIAGLESGSPFPVGTTTITFEALDVNGNTNTCSFDIIIHPTPILSTEVTNVSCNSLADGEIDLTVSNGSEPYTYDWSTESNIEDVSSLEPGNYSVIVTDTYGCQESASASITEPDLLVLESLLTNATCFGGNDGAIDITISGGTLPYSYNWSNNESTEDLNALSVGNYGVLVNDGNGCVRYADFLINEPSIISITAEMNSSTCLAPNGSITTETSGGTSPYSYEWTTGSTEPNLTNVVGGMYGLTVTDNNGCFALFLDSVTTIADIDGYIDITDVSCFNIDDGEATFVPLSGNGPYVYNWVSLSGDVIINENSNLNENLAAGQYSMTVTDHFGCEISLNFEINQPDSLVADLYPSSNSVGHNISTNGGNDGSIESDVNGGTEQYNYLWSNGATSSDIFNLSAGVYSVMVTDENGCTALAGIRITDPDVLEMPEGVSPNGDGDNDYFVVRGLDAYPDNDITIFNRWGNIVFQQNGYKNDWEGNNNNNANLPDGTYFVILNAHPAGTLTGYIDLRRK